MLNEKETRKIEKTNMFFFGVTDEAFIKRPGTNTKRCFSHLLLTSSVSLFMLSCDQSVCVFQNYRQCMAGLLVPPYGVMESVSNADSKYKHLSLSIYSLMLVHCHSSCGTQFRISKLLFFIKLKHIVKRKNHLESII